MGMRIRDLLDSGSGIPNGKLLSGIRYKHPGSATLVPTLYGQLASSISDNDEYFWFCDFHRKGPKSEKTSKNFESIKVTKM